MFQIITTLLHLLMGQLSLYAHPIARTAGESQCLGRPKCLTETCGTRIQHLDCKAPSEGPVNARNIGDMNATRSGCAFVGSVSEEGKLISTRNVPLCHC